MKLEFLNWFSKNIQIWNFIKIRPVGTELFDADGETDTLRQDKANGRNSAIASTIEWIYACNPHITSCMHKENFIICYILQVSHASNIPRVLNDFI
jgi:hypothetical protein